MTYPPPKVKALKYSVDRNNFNNILFRDSIEFLPNIAFIYLSVLFYLFILNKHLAYLHRFQCL